MKIIFDKEVKYCEACDMTGAGFTSIWILIIPYNFFSYRSVLACYFMNSSHRIVVSVIASLI